MAESSADALLRAALEFVEAAAQPVPVYGRFLSGDPRRFDPDPEECSPDQLAAWRQLCARWDAGDPVAVGAELVVMDDVGTRLVGVADMLGGMEQGDPVATELVSSIRAHLGMEPWQPRIWRRRH